MVLPHKEFIAYGEQVVLSHKEYILYGEQVVPTDAEYRIYHEKKTCTIDYISLMLRESSTIKKK